MLKNGMFIMTLGFIALILGLTSSDGSRGWILAAAFLLIIIGFVLYSRADKENKNE